MRLDAWRQHVERLHSLVVAVCVVLRHFHRLQLLQACFFLNFVLSLVGVVLQVPHVGDVSHVAHPVSQVAQVAEQHVERDGRASMSEVRIAVDSRTAHIHTDIRLVQRHELFLFSGERVIYE